MAAPFRVFDRSVSAFLVLAAAAVGLFIVGNPSIAPLILWTTLLYTVAYCLVWYSHGPRATIMRVANSLTALFRCLILAFLCIHLKSLAKPTPSAEQTLYAAFLLAVIVSSTVVSIGEFETPVSAVVAGVLIALCLWPTVQSAGELPAYLHFPESVYPVYVYNVSVETGGKHIWSWDVQERSGSIPCTILPLNSTSNQLCYWTTNSTIKGLIKDSLSPDSGWSLYVTYESCYSQHMVSNVGEYWRVHVACS